MIMQIENLYYTVFEKRAFNDSFKKNILADINFSALEGDILGITGESGSGKTTLAKIIAGILKPTSGKINIKYSVGRQNKISPVQLLFQNNGDILNPFRRGTDIIREVLEKRNLQDACGEMHRIIESLELSQAVLKRRAMELSGGEQQRIAIARALSTGPELLILDEPFSAQDPESQLNLLSLFLKINKEFGITIICITHYIGILRSLCKNIIVMYNGKIVEQGPSTAIFEEPKHDYTKFLLSAEFYKLTPEDFQIRRSIKPVYNHD